MAVEVSSFIPLSLAPSPGQPSTPTDSDLYRNSSDIMRMKSVHLDRKLSATARLPRRSTIVESVHPSDLLQPQRQQEQHPSPQIAPSQQGQQGQVHYYGQPSPQHSSPPPLQRAVPPHLSKPPMEFDAQGQILRPSFARNNTEVMLVDDSGPSSPVAGDEQQISGPSLDNGITLADIPQIMEVAQAREQQRSLPRQNSIPFIAELSAVELAIVKHCAVLALTRSPLKDHFDLDELLEMVETKKSGFWKTLFKNDKKNIKKKGWLLYRSNASPQLIDISGVFGVPLDLLVEREGVDSLLGTTRATIRVPSFIDDVISAMRQMG